MSTNRIKNLAILLLCAGKTFAGIPETDQSIRKDSVAVELSQITVVSRQFLNQIMKVDLILNPINSSQDLLRKTPGLFIAQHAGGGKAEQVFMRGFDSDHGTDIRISVDDLPVNMVSHAHGQGYSDLHFVIPETVENIDFGKGSYYADKGDFTTSGYVNLRTFDRLENSLVKVEGGMFNSVRTVALLNLSNEKQHNSYAAGEYNYADGPFDKPQHFNRVNLFYKANRQVNETTSIGLMASTFNSRWDASGQIPERAISQKLISRWGAIDDTEGGSTHRTNVALTLNRSMDTNTGMQSLFYFTNYGFNLFSNFTFYLNDPDYGDEIQQKENRNIYGMEHKYTKQFSSAYGNFLWKSGVGFRYDAIHDIELNHVYQRTTLLDKKASGDIGETNLNVYSSLEWEKGKWIINPGLRMDYFIFNLEDRLQPTKATQGQTAFRLSPKLNFSFNADKHCQFFLKTGMGFHSNDARVVIAQNGKETVPYSVQADWGAVFKPLPELAIQLALWYLYLQQEFVYVGDEAVVEPSGKTRRYGIDFNVRYHPLKWLYVDADINYAHPRAIGEPEGANFIPLAPVFTSVGGAVVRFNSEWSAGLRYRYMKDRPANEDNSVIAKGYFVNDLTLSYSVRNWELSLQAQNIFNVKWNEAQFDTETRLKEETEPVSEICFTPGNPFFLKAGVKYNF